MKARVENRSAPRGARGCPAEVAANVTLLRSALRMHVVLLGKLAYGHRIVLYDGKVLLSMTVYTSDWGLRQRLCFTCLTRRKFASVVYVPMDF